MDEKGENVAKAEKTRRKSAIQAMQKKEKEKKRGKRRRKEGEAQNLRETEGREEGKSVREAVLTALRWSRLQPGCRCEAAQAAAQQQRQQR